MNPAAWIEVEKTTTCNRCGDTAVAWIQGKKSNKWYLVNVKKDSTTGQLVANRFDFHRCPKRRS